MSFSTVASNYLLAPGKCCICGCGAQVDDRVFFDSGIQVEFYGAVYFCSLCVSAMGIGIGLTSEVKYSDLLSEYDALETKYTLLKAENEAIRYGMASVLNLSFDPPIDSDDLVRRIVSDVQISIARTKCSEGSTESNQGSDASSSSEGSGSVRDDAANPFSKGSKGAGAPNS